MAKDNGGPAFPAHEQWNEWSELKADYTPRTGPRGGMSLRDYFAAAALSAGAREFFAAGDCWDDYDDLAKSMYAIADAMLAERAK